ncbi:MAG: hypothetical protein AAGL89_14310 [Pseudomonadota bacterium]
MAAVTETKDPENLISFSISACEAQLQRAFQVCDLLEALADDLPRRQAPVWRETQRQCQSVLRPHFMLLINVVLPILLKRSKENVDREEVLMRLVADNESQLHALEDLDDLLSEAIAPGRSDNAESLGFALRGFFDTLRHNLTWEVDVVWPLAKRVFTEVDAKDLNSSPYAQFIRH